MLRMTAAIAAVSLLAASALAAPVAKSADPAPVLAAEHAFAARAGVVGMSPSFLEYMTDDAIIFAPDPMLARAFYGARPAGKTPKEGGTLLNWWPNFAGVAWGPGGPSCLAAPNLLRARRVRIDPFDIPTRTAKLERVA